MATSPLVIVHEPSYLVYVTVPPEGPPGPPGLAGPALIAYPKRTDLFKVVGEIASVGSTTVTIAASRLYYIPWVASRQVLIAQMGIGVTTASAGTASIGIYASGTVGSDHGPTSLLTSITGLDTGTTGFKLANANYALEPGTTYWFGLICSGTPTIRALVAGAQGSGVAAALGRSKSDLQHITYLFAAGSGATLPDPAPASLSNGSGAMPAIILAE